MDLTGKVINNTCIVRTLIKDEEFLQRWEAKAIFSLNTFFLDFFKDKDCSTKLAKQMNKLSEKLVLLQSISNQSVLKVIEMGEYNNCIYSTQQKSSGRSLYDYFNANTVFSEDISIKIVNNIINCI